MVTALARERSAYKSRENKKIQMTAFVGLTMHARAAKMTTLRKFGLDLIIIIML